MRQISERSSAPGGAEDGSVQRIGKASSKSHNRLVRSRRGQKEGRCGD
jgi:hypothetical protein